jgi:hypothetical protein
MTNDCLTPAERLEVSLSLAAGLIAHVIFWVLVLK